MKKYQLIVMSFDGDYHREAPCFEIIDKAWEYCNDLGSKWFFYPFCFVVSGNKVVDAYPLGDRFIGRFLKTIKHEFKHYSEKDELQNADPESFALAMA